MPPRRGPGGARDDYENAVKQAGAVIGYTIDALVADGDMVAAVWTGTLLGGTEIGKGLSLYRTSGGLLRSTRHALIETMPSWGSCGVPKPPGQPEPANRGAPK